MSLSTPQIKIGSLISFEVQIIFWMGVVFELPVVAFFLAKIGILNYRWLAKQWRWGFVGSIVLAAVITPTPDPINCTIVAAADMSAILAQHSDGLDSPTGQEVHRLAMEAGGSE